MLVSSSILRLPAIPIAFEYLKSVRAYSVRVYTATIGSHSNLLTIKIKSLVRCETEHLQWFKTSRCASILLLVPLLAPAGSVDVGSVLTQLIATHADPVIRTVIRYKLGFPTWNRVAGADADDLRQEVVAQLLTELNKFIEQPDTHPIADMRGLSAVIAHRVCARWMRQQFPERHALKNRLYYLLRRHEAFAIWREGGLYSILERSLA